MNLDFGSHAASDKMEQRKTESEQIVSEGIAKICKKIITNNFFKNT